MSSQTSSYIASPTPIQTPGQTASHSRTPSQTFVQKSSQTFGQTQPETQAHQLPIPQMPSQIRARSPGSQTQSLPPNQTLSWTPSRAPSLTTRDSQTATIHCALCSSNYNIPVLGSGYPFCRGQSTPVPEPPCCSAGATVIQCWGHGISIPYAWAARLLCGSHDNAALVTHISCAGSTVFLCGGQSLIIPLLVTGATVFLCWDHSIPLLGPQHSFAGTTVFLC